MTETNITTTKIILGIDEVGRGPWAGPLVVGAVILGEEFQKLASTTLDHPTNQALTEKLFLYQNLADSKQLSTKKRAELAPLIHKYAAAAATGWVSASEIDQYGLSASLKLATRRAVKQILSTKVKFSEIIIDGTINFLQNTPLENCVTLLKKADSLIKEVSAASIIAKIARDDYMVQLAEKYPEYGFENHVGYGTAKHKTALEKHGICPEHRLSFRPVASIAKASSDRTISATTPKNASKAPKIANSPKIIQNPTSKNHQNPEIAVYQSQNTTSKGQHAENLVAKHLESLGHTIIAHDFKTKTYEIDLISIKNDKIYFTEVKYRENCQHGSALNQITPQKLDQMRYAAEKFLSSEQGIIRRYADHPLQPLLAVASVTGKEYTVEDWFTL